MMMPQLTTENRTSSAIASWLAGQWATACERVIEKSATALPLAGWVCSSATTATGMTSDPGMARGYHARGSHDKEVTAPMSHADQVAVAPVGSRVAVSTGDVAHDPRLTGRPRALVGAGRLRLGWRAV